MADDKYFDIDRLRVPSEPKANPSSRKPFVNKTNDERAKALAWLTEGIQATIDQGLPKPTYETILDAMEQPEPDGLGYRVPMTTLNHWLSEIPIWSTHYKRRYR